MRISDWSSDVCSSDLAARPGHDVVGAPQLAGGDHSHIHAGHGARDQQRACNVVAGVTAVREGDLRGRFRGVLDHRHDVAEALGGVPLVGEPRSEEHTSELQSLMRISYAVFCLKKKKEK